MNKISIIFSMVILYSSTAFSGDLAQRPPDFVDIKSLVPAVEVEVRYAGSHNFVGRTVAGYNAPKCLISKQAAQAVRRVQTELETFGLKLRIYDCYRPQRAVNDFIAWAKDSKDNKARAEFYPDVEKTRLFDEGYIAAKSGHSKGSTLDLAIDGLDMGTPFDLFSPLSNTENAGVGGQAKANRMLLKLVMEKYGFKPYSKEWWHFTLKDEPYPNTYFDFMVE